MISWIDSYHLSNLNNNTNTNINTNYNTNINQRIQLGVKLLVIDSVLIIVNY